MSGNAAVDQRSGLSVRTPKPDIGVGRHDGETVLEGESSEEGVGDEVAGYGDGTGERLVSAKVDRVLGGTQVGSASSRSATNRVASALVSGRS